MGWERVLEAADVLLTPASPQEVDVELPSGARGRLRLVRSTGTLHASQMLRTAQAVSGAQGPEGPPRLWVARSAAPSALVQAREVGDSLVTSAGQLLLQVDGDVLERTKPTPSTTGVSAPQRGRPPWGAVGVARRLLEVDVDRQEDLALVCGVSQERVSRILSRLRAEGLLVKTTVRTGVAGRTVDRPASASALLDWLVASYPRGHALRAHYFAPDPPRLQLARAVGALDGRRPLLSGDLAADQLAPWRRPGHVLLYCQSPMDLAHAGFVSAPAGQASLTVVTSPDPTLAVPLIGATAWATAPAGEGPTQPGAGVQIELADPVQVLMDLLDSTAPDAPTAADRLRAALLHGPTGTTISAWLTDVIRAGATSASPRPAQRGASSQR